VKVKPHYRQPRSPEPRTKRKKFREGVLAGAAVGGTIGGTGLGFLLHANRQTAEQKIQKEVAKRLAEIAAKNAPKSLKILSAQLGVIIEFRSKTDEKQRAKWGALAGGVTGTASGGALGAYVGALHPEAVGAFTGEVTHQGLRQGMESIEGEIGEGWKPPGYGKHEPFARGAFGPAEAKARQRFLQRKALNKRVLRRIAKTSSLGALGLGTIGALGGYAASRAGMHHNQQRSLSARLDDVIAFR
jgi:hypothetical protein